MLINDLITQARRRRASDLHLEPSLAPVFRVDGELESNGEPLSASDLTSMARGIIGEANWPHFVKRRSHDVTRTISGARCRINLFQTARGTALAVRLLAPFRANLETLNLHPDLEHFTHHRAGLVIISGATGSGKSTTLAALLEAINERQARHILTIEAPIEYHLKPRRSLIRQREVGRDTPSFEQALLDALREDPDIIVVGEMRSPDTMRLTLAAAETGHLVFATLHAATPIEALNRLVSSFAPDIQAGVRAQLADCLRGIVCQRLVGHSTLGVRVPECEILTANDAVRGMLRKGDVFRIQSAIETGREDGMWTFARYRGWIQSRTDLSAGAWMTSTVEEEPVPEPAMPASVPDAPQEEGQTGAVEIDSLIEELERS